MIVVKNVNKKFGRLHVLKDINLTCDKGACIALIGPNGSGKTTLIKSLLGMVIPNSGDITVAGQSVKNNWRYRSHIGYMPQIGHYPDNMTIGQIIDMMKDIAGTEAKVDSSLMEAFSLSSISNKRMRTLSGGTRQKVSASLAFMFEPGILVLDEPTAGLDPVATEILKAKIEAEKQKGKLILITSHVLSDLDDLVTHVIYMQEGTIVFHKPIDALQQVTGEVRLNKAIAKIMSGVVYE